MFECRYCEDLGDCIRVERKCRDCNKSQWGDISYRDAEEYPRSLWPLLDTAWNNGRMPGE